jgi:hypothetical protein
MRSDIAQTAQQHIGLFRTKHRASLLATDKLVRGCTQDRNRQQRPRDMNILVSFRKDGSKNVANPGRHLGEVPREFDLPEEPARSAENLRVS